LDNSTGDVSDKLDELRKERDTALAKVADRSMQLAQTRAKADELSDELQALERDRQRATWGEKKSGASWFGKSMHDQMGSIGNSTPIAAASKLFKRSNSTDNPL
jgi:chromosome segregation ATPase